LRKLYLDDLLINFSKVTLCGIDDPIEQIEDNRRICVSCGGGGEVEVLMRDLEEGGSA
jgi:hypothetical protein